MRPEFESIPKYGFGCMRLPLTDPDDQTSIDMEHFKRMVDAFMAAGCTYFDTAFVYHDGASETALREALVKRYPRESFTIATKCLAWSAPDAETAQSNLATSLERLGTDYVDFYLLHNVGGKRTAKYDEYGMWDFIAEQKAAGRVRYAGFSMHDDAKALDNLLTSHPEVDFVQLQVNYLDWEDSVIQSRRLMEVAEKHDMPVIIMEPARGGRLANLPERVAGVFKAAKPETSPVTWANRFCWNLPNVVTVLSGVSNIEQMEENLAEFAANKPFTPEEQSVFDEAIRQMHAVPTVPCTNCGYCVKGCPEGIVIPDILNLLNLEMLTDDRAFAAGQYTWRAAAGPASKCIGCGSCEDMCPQSIDIVHQLELAAEHFEGE